jgi:ubiquinone/menaquinone biosynthesis C-methylase UbiE
MKIENQKEIWNAIAPEWSEFKIGKKAHHTLNFLKKQKGKILDLGSGSGRYLQKIPNGKMYLVDFSKEMIKLAKNLSKKNKIPANFFVSDISKIPFEDNFFDGAICISSLHCIKGKSKRKEVLKELFRVLKPKAQAEIGVWNKESPRFKNSSKEKLVRWRDKGKRYYYLYEKQEIYNESEEAGFKIIWKEDPCFSMVNFIVEKP